MSDGDEHPAGLREASRERNRTAIVDAVLELVMEGNLRPSADQIAERSGVSRRTLFRYFDDLDDLGRNAVARQLSRSGHLLELPRSPRASLAERVSDLAAQRLRLFQRLAPGLRMSRLRAPFARVAAEELQRSRSTLREQVEKQLSLELRSLPSARRRRTFAALDVLFSFETYEQLCAAQGMSGDEYRAVVREAAMTLLGGRR